MSTLLLRLDPVHLLTREAMSVYLSRLNPGGIILTHISNNHLDLTDVVAATAAARGWWRALRRGRGAGPRPDDQVLDRDDSREGQRDFGPLADWDLHKAPPGQTPWSDDYSNLLGPLIKKLREGD